MSNQPSQNARNAAQSITLMFGGTLPCAMSEAELKRHEAFVLAIATVIEQHCLREPVVYGIWLTAEYDGTPGWGFGQDVLLFGPASAMHAQLAAVPEWQEHGKVLPIGPNGEPVFEEESDVNQ